ncbi:hypothetical protein BW99_09445 [Escherichia coli O157:H7 str. 08-3527]|uniref:Uncharacterized protein n=2 Tax=Traversvirus TaxID=1981157 RepID=Q7Y2U0_9CAUD|nr:hypothetical protein Stx1_p042 [Escherichia Stx1 converting phage]NP_859286.1 hypothetical protein Stx2II_p041 [Escherichia phage Stx2 II]EYU96415.1 hypothetical protein BX59_01945 [Escherichia coli O111:NM str. 2010C-4086]EYV77998.1 hypothetical protein BY91_17070 [Escherichia coli O157:H7 str. K5806]EYV92531.1 hypothetical protein BY51_03595 [Escherichia coli O157:H7 str. F7350]EYW82138.1 hypothetical protein BY19_19270 [Escherichia coli O157:H7 str. 2011EL-2099]EYW89981.1 hypothetical p
MAPWITKNPAGAGSECELQCWFKHNDENCSSQTAILNTMKPSSSSGIRSKPSRFPSRINPRLAVWNSAQRPPARWVNVFTSGR